MNMTFDGITQPITEWALDYGIPVALIRSRLRRGWDEERAITEPMIVRRTEKLPADAMLDLPPKPPVVTPPPPIFLTGMSPASTREPPPRFKIKPAPPLIEHDGHRLTVKGWAKRIGIHPNTLAIRLSNGWPLERALTKRAPTKRVLTKTVTPTPCLAPARRRGGRGAEPRTLEHDGLRLTTVAWANRLGIQLQTINWRLRKGWPVEEVLLGNCLPGTRRPVQGPSDHAKAA